MRCVFEPPILLLVIASGLLLAIAGVILVEKAICAMRQKPTSLKIHHLARYGVFRDGHPATPTAYCNDQQTDSELRNSIYTSLPEHVTCQLCLHKLISKN